MASNTYSANEGERVTFECETKNMGAIDIVWVFYPNGFAQSKNVIYFENKYQNNWDNKFDVNILPGATSIRSTLTIKSVKYTDADYTYQCECNIYKSNHFDFYLRRCEIMFR